MDTQTREVKTGGKAEAPERRERWGKWKGKRLEIAIPVALVASLCVMGAAIYMNHKSLSTKCAQTANEIIDLAEKSDSLSRSSSAAVEQLRRGYVSDDADMFLQISSKREYTDALLRNKIVEWRTQCSGQEKPTQ